MTDIQARPNEQRIGQKPSYTNNYNTSTWNSTNSYSNNQMAPPQEYAYDQAASESASQPRSNLWQNGSTSLATPTNTWNGQNQTNGITAASASYAEQSTSNKPNANVTRPPVNGISINTINRPISSSSSVINTENGKILCVADVRGQISQLNALARETGAKAVIHTGDFGFIEKASLERINDKTLRHLIQYSSLVPPQMRSRLLGNSTNAQELRRTIVDSATFLLSEFPLFLEGKLKLDIPVYTIWGVCEDVTVLESFRSGKYSIPNLNILDEAHSYPMDIGNINLRLFGLGGALVQHKLFDNGDGVATIAGGGGTMWTTILQIGELVETAQKVYHPSETRILVTQASPGRDGLLAQLSLALRADFTISAGLHFRYAVSYNEFSVQGDQETFRSKLENSRKSFLDMWENVKSQVEGAIDGPQRVLLSNALQVINRVPAQEKEEPAFKNMWNFNLSDAAFGHLILNVNNGRVAAEIKAQGFNFAYRRSNGQPDGANTTSVSGIPGPNSPNSNSPMSRRQLSQWVTPPQQQTNRGPSPTPPNPDRSTATYNTWSESTPASDLSQSKMNGTTNVTSTHGSANNAISTTNNHNNINDNNSNNNNIDNNRTTAWADQSQNGDGDWLNDAPIDNAYNNINGNLSESSENANNSSGNNNNQRNGHDTSSNNLNVPQNQNQNRYQRNPYSVHVGQLNNFPSEDEIREFFSPIEVDRVRLMFATRDDPTNQQRRNYVYVEFKDDASVVKALELNGKPLGQDNPIINKTTEQHNNYRFGRGRGRGRRGGGYNRGNYRGNYHNSHNGGQ